MSPTLRRTYNSHDSLWWNILPYCTSSRIQFFHKSVGSTLTIALALICFVTPPFSYTNISVWISGIWGCIPKIIIWFEIIGKMDGGEETHFLDFATQMKLLSLCQKIGLIITHKWVFVLFPKGRKGYSLSYDVPKIRRVLKKVDFWFVQVQVSKRT